MFTVEDEDDEEVEEGEEVDEDVPSLLSLEQTNGGDHLLLGEVVDLIFLSTSLLGTKLTSSRSVSQSSFTLFLRMKP